MRVRFCQFSTVYMRKQSRARYGAPCGDKRRAQMNQKAPHARSCCRMKCCADANERERRHAARCRARVVKHDSGVALRSAQRAPRRVRECRPIRRHHSIIRVITPISPTMSLTNELTFSYDTLRYMMAFCRQFDKLFRALFYGAMLLIRFSSP